MTLCAKEHYSKRELERQMDSAYYERFMLSSKKLIPESVPQDVRGSILIPMCLNFLICRSSIPSVTFARRSQTI